MTRMMELPAELQARTEPECTGCDDSGWSYKFCDGRHDVICGRSRAHLPHDFVVECPCRPMNRTYQARVESGRRLA